MEQFDNNKMDEIFRKAAEEPHYDFNPAAWERLNEKLTTIDNAIFFRKALKYRALELATLFLITTLAVIATNVLPDEKLVLNKITPHHNSNGAIAINPKSAAIVSQNENTKILVEDKISKIGSRKNRTTSFPTRFIPVLNQDEIVTTTNVEVINIKNQIIDNQIVREESQSLNQLKSKEDFTQFDVENLKTSSEIDYQVPEVLPKKKGKLSDKGNLSILVGYAPDLSSVGFKNFGEIGQNANFQLKYQVLKNWGISAGVTISEKKYNALPEEYRPQPQIWSIWAKPDRITGDSKVIDISLNIHRTLVSGERFKIYASTGLSSYWILEEKYQYYFDVTGSKMDVPANKESQSLLGVSNFSMGYEQQLNNRLSLVAEPYLKVPLTQVGFAKMRLFSAGLNVSIKYNLGKF